MVANPDTSYHVAGIQRDDHPQYARTDGTRAFTGGITVPGLTDTGSATVGGTLGVTGAISGSSAALSGALTAQSEQANLTGTAGRYVGSTNGSPTGGPYNTGDFADDPTNQCFWECSAGGSPGTWVQVGRGLPPLGKAYDNTGQALSNGTPAFISLGANQKLQSGMALTSGKLVVPSAGEYWVSARIGVQVSTNAMTLLDCYIAHNGAVAYGFDRNSYSVAANAFDWAATTALVACAANDTIELWGRADSTTTQHCSASQASTYLHVIQVSN